MSSCASTKQKIIVPLTESSSIKNGLRKSFADKANDFALALSTLSTSLSGLEGDVEDQLRLTQRLSGNLEPLDQYLDIIAGIDRQCEEANIEENDFTTYTYDELEYELGLVKRGVSRKLAFLENQTVARNNMTNLTPIQLEEFESVFRHFDRAGRNSLQELEFSAALASLGLVYDEDEMHDKFGQTGGGRELVSFEQFIRFMVDVTEDQNTAEQVLESFREVADGKVNVLFSPPPPPRTCITNGLGNLHNFFLLTIPRVVFRFAAVRDRGRSATLARAGRDHRRAGQEHAAAQGTGFARGSEVAQVRLRELHGQVRGWCFFE